MQAKINKEVEAKKNEMQALYIKRTEETKKKYEEKHLQLKESLEAEGERLKLKYTEAGKKLEEEGKNVIKYFFD
jgi:hypothetical protein